MNIQNWPIGRIMQLPDCCFGRRWPIGVYAPSKEIGVHYDISEAGLGNTCVVWLVTFNAGGSTTARTNISLALGDVLPTTDAEFDALEPMFSDLGRRVATRRQVEIGGFGIVLPYPMRKPVMAQGRRVVGRFEILGPELQPPMVILEVSSIPTEVTDWLISGPGRCL